MLALLCIAMPAGHASAQAPDERLLAPMALARHIEGASRETYRATLADYDRALAARPDDARLAVARCEFINDFTYDEGAVYLEEADHDFSACTEALEALDSKDPGVLVYLFEQDWDDESIAQGEFLLAESSRWPTELRRRIASKLSWQFGSEEAGKSGEMALLAAELGDADRVAAAIEYLAGTGDTARALALLERTPPAGDRWAADRRIRAVLRLDDPKAALGDLKRHELHKLDVGPGPAALAHLRAGDRAAAAALLDEAGDDKPALEDARFRVAMVGGDWRTAAALVDLLDMERFSVQLDRFVSLAVAAPWTLVAPSMWPSLLVLLGVMAAIALLPGVLVVPVHYRGAIRRLKAKVPVALFEGIGLRHAWLALATILLLPMIVLGVVDSEALIATLDDGATPSGRALLLTAAVGSVLGLALFAVPLAGLLGRGRWGWVATRQAWGRLLIAWIGTFAVGVVLGLVHAGLGTDTTTKQIEMAASLVNSGSTAWSVALAFATVALLVPIWEEAVFRGLLLGGMARHISFGWANLVQASLFALVHDDAPRFVYYLALGLFSGWLVRSTRSLGPAIALHMLINATAFLLIFR